MMELLTAGYCDRGHPASRQLASGMSERIDARQGPSDTAPQSMQEVTARLSRRNLLKTGLFGTLLVGLGSLGLALQKSSRPAATPTLRLLDADEYAVLAAVADRVCPALGPGAPGAAALEIAARIDQRLASADSEVQKGTRIALRVFENGLSGALSGERLVPFTQLDAEAQDRVLASWRDSRVGFRRTVYRGLTGAVFAMYWGDPRTWQRIGYGGPPDFEKLRSVYADQLLDFDALRASPLAKGA
jgi:hypothetical protein